MLSKTKIFFAFYHYSGKADLGKGYWHPKRKSGVPIQFSEIIKLQLSIRCLYFSAFLNFFSEKSMVTPIFFLDSNKSLLRTDSFDSHKLRQKYCCIAGHHPLNQDNMSNTSLVSCYLLRSTVICHQLSK